MCNCGSVGPRLCVEGKKALSEIYFYQLISRPCWCVSAVVIASPSSSLRSGVMVRQGMQQPAWLLILLAGGLTPSKLCPWIQGHIPWEELAYRYTEFCQSSAEVLSQWWLPLIFFLSPEDLLCLSRSWGVEVAVFANGWVTGLESEVKGCRFPNSCSYLLILNDSGRSVRVGRWPGRTSSGDTLVFCSL